MCVVEGLVCPNILLDTTICKQHICVGAEAVDGDDYAGICHFTVLRIVGGDCVGL